MDAKEQQLQRKIAEEELNSAYRTLFGADPHQRTTAQNRVILDFEDILKARIHVPDKNGHYDPIRAAIEDGGRKLITDILKRINSKADKLDAEDAKTKPKTIK